jgi:hypothetical protein
MKKQQTSLVVDKEKEVGRTQTHQPLKDLDRAAATQPYHNWEHTSEAAELQQKMKMAAKKLVAADGADDETYQRLDPATRLPDVDLYVYQYLSMLHCTPKDVFLLWQRKPFEGWETDEWGWEWVRLSAEYVATAFKEIFSAIVVDEKLAAELLLKGIRKYCKQYGKVSWTLPRLTESGVAAQ